MFADTVVAGASSMAGSVTMLKSEVDGMITRIKSQASEVKGSLNALE